MGMAQIKLASRASRIGEYYFSKKLLEIRQMRERGIDVLNLGIGNPDLPPPSNVIEKLVDTARESTSHGYQPYRGIPDLRKAISLWYKRIYKVDLDPNKEVLPLIGSKEGVFYISMTFIDFGDNALVPNPGYPGYAAATSLAGGTPVYYDLKETNNWLPDLKQLDELADEKTRVLWISYPHMPTGAVINRQKLSKLVDWARSRNILL